MPDDSPVTAPGRPLVRVATTSGEVLIRAEDRDDVEVTSGGTSERWPSSHGEAIDVHRSGSLELRCPIGSDVVAGTSSGEVRLRGAFGNVRVTSQSGSIRVERAGSIDLRTRSGDADVERCDGLCRVTTTSGSVRIHGAEATDVRGVSGSIDVTATTARVRTVSGTVDVASNGDTAVESVSGSITVSLAPGVRPRVLTRALKRVRVQVPEGDDCEIAVRTISGTVTVCSR